MSIITSLREPAIKFLNLVLKYLLSKLLPIINKTQNTGNKDTKENNSNVVGNNLDNYAELETIFQSKRTRNLITEVKEYFHMKPMSKNQIVVESSQAILDGSDSRDRDGKIDLYQWQQIKGPKVALENANNIEASLFRVKLIMIQYWCSN